MEPPFPSVSYEVPTRTDSPDHQDSLMKPSHDDEDDYSPVPATVMSSSSSPASASDYGYHHVQMPDHCASTDASIPTPNPLLHPMPTAIYKQPHHPATMSGSSSSSMPPPQIVAPTATALEATRGHTNIKPDARQKQETKTKIEQDEREPPSGSGGGGTGKRRQKRLERNRESARLSRRRRKHYLEVLEENVNERSAELDKERRKHVSRAVWTIQNKRLELLAGPGKEELVQNVVRLDNELSRTSPEIRVANTFQSQQLKSFAMPPSTKFILWLSLQNEAFFRGGRANSERLSAARIGERMLSSGTTHAAPNQNMWPLFCNEVGLSYEQEEKVRNYQRSLLQTQETWLHRHTAFASGKTMETLHENVQGLTLSSSQRERTSQSILSDKQRLKLAAWSTRNREKLRAKLSALPVTLPVHGTSQFKTSPTQHAAANIYSANHQLTQLLNVVPPAPPMIAPHVLKKLSRRPLFESLGCGQKDGDEEMSRDKSFSSTGSLKRSMQEMSMDGDERVHVPSVSPEAAEAAAGPLVDRTLGHLKDIIPEPPTPSVVAVGQASIILPAPTPVSAMSVGNQLPTSASFPPHNNPHPGAPDAKHARKLSFLPANLNVVPEELWPGEASDDFFMNLVDGDWAIGEGIDMDMEVPM